MISPELLRRYPFFSHFTEQELKGLAMLAGDPHFAPGEIIFREGDQARQSYLIVEGSVDVLLNIGREEERLVAVSTLEAGEWLAWSTLIPPFTLSATARAVTPTTLIAFDGPALLAMCEVDTHFGFRLMSKIAQVISERLHNTRVQLVSITPEAVR